MKPLAVIQHDRLDPPGTIGRHLTSIGFPWRLIDVSSGHEVPPTLDAYSGLILMGGDFHIHQEQEYPFLVRERRLIETCLAEQSPILAICLGAQLVADVAGGRVYQRSYPEIGWLEVETTAHDPLLIGVESPFMTMQWHDYSFTLPPGAMRVAARSDGEQVFRVGMRAWGVQFHPEVDADRVERWIRADQARLEEMMTDWPAQIRAATQVHVRQNAAFCRLLVDNFLVASSLVAEAG